MKRRWVRISLKALAVLVALPLLYFVAMVLGSVIPANAGWREPETGVPIFVRTNGVHTWIMVPAVTPQMDWRPLAPVAHVRDPERAGNYLAIGFGNRDFYLNTPTWADLRVDTALAAGFGLGPGLVHVEHEAMPREDDLHRGFVLRPGEYRRLVAFLRSSFAIGADGRSVPLPGRGYGSTDVFYQGAGRYDMFRTCNEWTGEALRSAGIRIGLWTPLEWSVMRWFEPV